MQIDFTQAITAEAKALAEADTRATAIKATCRARILAVGSETTQMNIAQAGITFLSAMQSKTPRNAALAASGLREGDLMLARAWKAWVAAMQAACRASILSGDAPNWPEVPEGVADLAERF